MEEVAEAAVAVVEEEEEEILDPTPPLLHNQK